MNMRNNSPVSSRRTISFTKNSDIMSTEQHPIKKAQPGNERLDKTNADIARKGKIHQDNPDAKHISPDHDPIDDQIDNDLHTSMEEDMDRGAGGLNRGLGEIGEMQGEDTEDEISASLDEDLYDSVNDEDENDDDEIYDDKVQNLNA